MNCKIQALTLLALAFVCAESTVVPPRCLCLNVVKMVPFRLVEDYLIIPKETHCSKIQIILAVNMNNSKMETCLDPKSKQGRSLVACWERIGHDITRKRECIPTSRRGTNN
ncbi:C-X-C motif chemokine 11-like [Rhincodon typus]|uniref:C-X-C motif chemokine 11-like n=1 Tax=Rhincodon typus TaxID=259920 RepID=UPI0009A3EEC5|nr:C-X-C motif chemokine 11-like [Rhincodon typus]